MRTNWKNTIPALFFITAIVLVSGCSVQKKMAQETSPFLVTAKTEANNKITLTCTQGCAWKALSYTISENIRVQAIDEYGMADLNDLNTETNTNLSNFLFTVEKSGDRLILKGLEGTAWTELSFSTTPYKSQGIDKMGMAGN